MSTGFPKKYPGRSQKEHPITGDLAKIKIEKEHRELIERIVIGLFLDMQDKPLTEVMLSCYITGANHALMAERERADTKTRETAHLEPVAEQGRGNWY